MRVFNVISTLVIGDDTSVIVDAPLNDFKKGLGVIDDSGKPYEILSIGMSNGKDVESSLKKTNLLIQGHFKSQKMYM